MKNELLTISEVSQKLQVTPRMLRYYEKLGLIQSRRLPDYAYRVYDAENTQRIKQILFLRKLRLSLKEIQIVLDAEQTQVAITIFRQSIAKIDQETAAYDLIKQALQKLLIVFQDELEKPLLFLEDQTLQSLIEAIPSPRTTLKEEISMTNLENAEKTLSSIDPRIIFLPDSYVAASHFIGADPEINASQPLWEFIRENKLWEKKPDLRLFGFNHPNPQENQPEYGYEFWVTIPAALSVPAPLKKKHFTGGQYAALTIAFGDFEKWAYLDQWVSNSQEYQYRGKGLPENMFDSLEEQLDAYSHLKENNSDFPHLDIMIPVREINTK